ncbi:MAG: hypothetical protein ACLR2O_02055 [Coprococcus sp.]
MNTRVDVDLVLIAAGFLGSQDYMTKAFGVEVNERTNVELPAGAYSTNVKNVFTAGDMHRGQSLGCVGNPGRARGCKGCRYQFDGIYEYVCPVVKKYSKRMGEKFPCINKKLNYNRKEQVGIIYSGL